MPDRSVTEGFAETVMASPIGWLRVRTMDQRLSAIDFQGEDETLVAVSPPVACTAVCAAIERYFSRPQPFPELVLETTGTAFQQRVWQALQEIPVGQVVAYGQLAARLGSSARAVGNACRHNPIPLVVPCHRVVARNGLGGLAGATSGRRVAIKRWLLRHEGVEIPGS